jgi:hypothetical protein
MTTWAIVSMIWSLILATLVGLGWALGEYLYLAATRYHATFHISGWAFGVGVLAFALMLLASRAVWRKRQR